MNQSGATLNQNMKIALAIIALLIATVAAPASTDITSDLGATTIAASTTNTTAATRTIPWKLDSKIVFQFVLAGTNANSTSPVTVLFDTTQNGLDWKSTSYTASVTNTGAATNTFSFILTNTSGLDTLRWSGVRNPNTNAIRFSRVNYATVP